MKKFIAMILIVAMCCTVPTTVFASTQANDSNIIKKSDVISTVKTRVEIAEEKSKIYKDIYVQLKQQNKTELMGEFIAAVNPMIEMGIYEKNDPEYVAASATYTLSNGGVIGYQNSIGGYVVNTYLTPTQFNKYLKEGLKTTAGTIIKQILGFTPGGWGVFFTALFSLQTVVTKAQINKVLNESGGYGIIMNVSDASGANRGSAILAWKTHPKASLPSGAKNIHVQKF